MKKDDVTAMVQSQKRLQQMISGEFRFNLGFSGRHFYNGNDEENKGSEEIVAQASEFTWFDHTFGHSQAHMQNYSTIVSELELNKQFAREKGIKVSTDYTVPPHHSGVYPIHDAMYDAWEHVYGIRATSTEGYPHLRPDTARRGFIYKNVMVLPRQLCGLFTHTVKFDAYPGGRKVLESSINGGELFQTILHNEILVFMTHMTNYANDRLALYTFEKVISLLQKWTNLQFLYLPPLQVAHLYFQKYPQEKEPIWTNPCDDRRHMEIYPKWKDCEKLPQVLVIGPQKTGTTALYTFLGMHPNITPNLKSEKHFEEIQFFNWKEYKLGIDWYMKYFPKVNKSTTVVFEKSANYFDSSLAPRRAAALLPKAKLIVILSDPSKRAYSWYQHQRSHNDSAALKRRFSSIITSNDTSNREVRTLRDQCLKPGLYAQHLKRWLRYFKPTQIYTIDGDELVSDPVSVMEGVQEFLGVHPKLDYSRRLKYNKQKGFFCQIFNGRSQCLGKGKGREYPEMDMRAAKYLKGYYRSHNEELFNLLKQLKYDLPSWLVKDILEEN